MTGAISDFISNISYDMFLIHHVAIIYILKVIDPFESMLMNVVYMLADIVLIIIVSVIFSKIMKRLLKTKMFRNFDNWMMCKVCAL